jgi:hypothetical protein
MKRRLVRNSSLAFVVLVGIIASPAAAKPRSGELRLVRASIGAFATDGERYLLEEQNVGRFVVVNTITNRTRRFSVPHCGIGTQRTGLGGGHAVLFCNVGPQRVLDLRDGSTRALPATVTVGNESPRVTFFFTGRYWVYGEAGCPTSSTTPQCTVVVNIRTGAQQFFSGRPRLDLNSPQLGSLPTCQRYQSALQVGNQDLSDRIFEPPYFIQTLHRTSSRPSKLLLRRCDGTALTLGRGGRATLSSGVASWLTSGKPEADAYKLSTHQFYNWRIPKPGRFGAEVAHTRNRVFIGVIRYISGYTPGAYRLYEAAL